MIQLGELVKKLEQELEEAQAGLSEKQHVYEVCIKTVKMLENSVKDHDSNRENRLKHFEKKIKEVKSQMQSVSKDLKVSVLEASFGSIFFLHVN